MSYSVCLKCKAMVGWYDKYCRNCQDKYGLPDDREFQKTWFPNKPFDEAAAEEVEKDMARGDA